MPCSADVEAAEEAEDVERFEAVERTDDVADCSCRACGWSENVEEEKKEAEGGIAVIETILAVLEVGGRVLLGFGDMYTEPVPEPMMEPKGGPEADADVDVGVVDGGDMKPGRGDTTNCCCCRCC